jgi:hypothetical protein
MKVLGVVKAASLLIWLAAVLGLSLFIGLMIATAGGAMYTPLLKVAAPFACDGAFEIESRRYSSRPGQSGVEHRIFCRDRATGARADITLYAVFIAFLVYSGLTLVSLSVVSLLLSFPLRLLFRRLKPAAEGALSRAATPAPAAASAPPRIIFNGREYSGPEEMPAEARAAYERAMSVFADSDRDGVPDLFEGLAPQAKTQEGIAERLTRLRGLRDAGLITDEEYEAKKAEILSEL